MQPSPSGASRAPIRLGIIGTGLATERLHWPALRQMPDRFHIAAFANHTRPKAEAFARMAGVSMDDYYADYAEMLRRSDVDAVLVVLPISLLYAATKAALEAGKHVICEKPAGANLEQGLQFLALAEQYRDRKVLIAENYFYKDDLRLAQSLLMDGVIGRVHLAAWRVMMQSVPREAGYTSTLWRQSPSYRGGPHLDAGVHHWAQLRMLCGDVQELQAFTYYSNPTMGGPSDLVTSLKFVSNAIGSYTAGFLSVPTPEESNAMRLYGSDGVMEVASGAVRIFKASGETTAYAIDADGGYYNQLLNFYDAIVYDEPIVGSIQQSVHNLLLVMRALDSAEEQRLIPIADAPGGLSPTPVPLWRPREAAGLFDRLPTTIREVQPSHV